MVPVCPLTRQLLFHSRKAASGRYPESVDPICPSGLLGHCESILNREAGAGPTELQAQALFGRPR